MPKPVFWINKKKIFQNVVCCIFDHAFYTLTDTSIDMPDTCTLILTYDKVLSLRLFERLKNSADDTKEYFSYFPQKTGFDSS